MRACQTCCCLFSLQSGAQSIGLFCFVLSTIDLSSSLYQILGKAHTGVIALQSILYGYGVLYAGFVVLSIGLIYGAQARKRIFLVLWILNALAICALELTQIWLLTLMYEVQVMAIAASAIHAAVILYFTFVVINAVVEITRTNTGNKVSPSRKNSVVSEVINDEDPTLTVETTAI